MPLDDLFSALLRSGYGANPIDTQIPFNPVVDALNDPSSRLANGYAINMNPPQAPKTVEEHQAAAAEAAHKAKIAKADADFAQAAAKARAAKASESTGGTSTSSFQWPEMPNSFSMFQGPENSPFTRLLAFQAQSVPQPDIKTSVDENGMATIKAPVDVLGQGLGMLRQYQSLIQSLDQQMQARDAELAAKEQFAKANPLLHALGLLSANIAQQPQMPGFVRALGATAGQLHAENDPNRIEAERRQLIGDRLGLAQAASNQALAEVRLNEAMDQKKLELEQRKFNSIVRNLKNIGAQEPEFFQARGFSRDLAENLSDASKQNKAVQDDLMDLKQQTIQIQKDRTEIMDRREKAYERIQGVRNEINRLRVTKGSDPEKTSAQIAKLQAQTDKIRQSMGYTPQFIASQIGKTKQGIANALGKLAFVQERIAEKGAVMSQDDRLLADRQMADAKSSVESLRETLAMLEKDRDEMMMREAAAPAATSVAQPSSGEKKKSAPTLTFSVPGK